MPSFFMRKRSVETVHAQTRGGSVHARQNPAGLFEHGENMRALGVGLGLVLYSER